MQHSLNFNHPSSVFIIQVYMAFIQSE